MSRSDASVGLMDAAYFVSKNELLAFFNATLDMNLTKIEQTCTGAVACQLCEYIFPRSIPVSRIDWSCKASFEYVANYKLLQAAFTKNRVRRHLDVDKLIQGKFQINLEFCQWLKAWHDQQVPDRGDYDAAAVRAKGKGGKNLPPQFRSRASGSAGGGGSARRPPRSASSLSSAFSADTPSRPSSSASSSTPGSRRHSSIPSSSVAKKRATGIGGGGLPPPAAGRTHKENSTPSAANRSLATPKRGSRPTSTAKSSSSAVSAATAAAAAKSEAALTEANKKATELTNRMAELQLLLEKSDAEKEFYFEKLRGVEALVYANDLGTDGSTAEQVVQRIGKVLSVGQGEEIPVDESGHYIGNEDDDDGDALMDVVAEPSSPYPAASDLLQEVADDGSDDMDLMSSPTELMA